MDNVKTIVDIIGGIVTILAAIGGLLLAVGVWAISSTPKFRLQQVYWNPRTPRPKLNKRFPISVQFQIFSGAIGSKVATEIEIKSLLVEQAGATISFIPYTSLELLELTDKKTRFAARAKELSQIFLMTGSENIVKHVGFHLDDGQIQLHKGELTFKMDVIYTTYDPIRQVLSLVGLAKRPSPKRETYEYKTTITTKEAINISKGTEEIWPYWFFSSSNENP